MNAIVNSELRKKAKKGIDQANDVTVKMILAILEVQENENEEELASKREILQRFKDYEEGKVKPITLDELESAVRKSHLQLKRSK